MQTPTERSASDVSRQPRPIPSSARGLFITCSDPCLDARLIEQLQEENLLILRQPANVVRPYGTGTTEEESLVEAALSESKIGDIIVCGHLGCSVLDQCLNDAAGASSESPCRSHVPVEATRRIVQAKYRHLPAGELRRAAVEENVFVQMANLRTYPAVMANLARGTLRLHSWIYDADRDEIYGYGPRHSQFLKRIKQLARPTRRLLPSLDPCDIYLA